MADDKIEDTLMNSPTRSALASLILLLAVSLSVAAQNPAHEGSGSNESGRILSLENSWNQAETRHDKNAMSLLIADTFAYTDVDGSFMNREQWLDHVKSEADEYETLANTGMQVQFYGDAAVVTGDYHERIRLKGKPVVRSGRFTDTWIRQNGQWKCVASQSTLTTH